MSVNSAGTCNLTCMYTVVQRHCILLHIALIVAIQFEARVAMETALSLSTRDVKGLLACLLSRSPRVKI